MNGHDHDRRRDEPTQHEHKLSGKATLNVVVSGAAADPAVLAILTRIEQAITALGNSDAQAQINELVSRLKAATDAQAAVVAANQPKE